MSLNQDFLQNDFERVFQDESLKTDVIYQGQSFWKDVWHRWIKRQAPGSPFSFCHIANGIYRNSISGRDESGIL